MFPHQAMKLPARLISGMLALTLAILAGCTGKTEDISIINAWIAEAPPTSKVMVGYLTLVNNTSRDLTIVKARSQSFSSIEFHETIHEDGMARMVRHESLPIPAGEELILTRGGRHLMLFNPVSAFRAGDRISITLVRQDGIEITIQPEVRKAEF